MDESQPVTTRSYNVCRGLTPYPSESPAHRTALFKKVKRVIEEERCKPLGKR